MDWIKRTLHDRVSLCTHDIVFSHKSHLGSQHPSVLFANSVNLTQPVFLIYPDMWGVKMQSQTGMQERYAHLFCLPCRGCQLPIINATAPWFFAKNLATAPQLSPMQLLFGGQSRSWGCERSKAFQSSRFSQMDPRQLGWNTARGWSCHRMMSLAIEFFPFSCSLKTFYLFSSYDSLNLT